MDSMGSQQNNGHLQPHEVTDSDHAPATTTISTVVLLSHPIQIVVGLLQVYSFGQALLQSARTKNSTSPHKYNESVQIICTHFSATDARPLRVSNRRTTFFLHSIQFYSSAARVFLFFSSKALRFGCSISFAFYTAARLTGSKFMGFCSVLMTCLNG